MICPLQYRSLGRDFIFRFMTRYRTAGAAGRRTESSADIVTLPCRGAFCTLDRDDPPPDAAIRSRSSAWLYFLPTHSQFGARLDGHARLAASAAGAPARRMYAGNRVDVVRPLGVGRAIRRVSTIVDVSEKPTNGSARVRPGAARDQLRGFISP